MANIPIVQASARSRLSRRVFLTESQENVLITKALVGCTDSASKLVDAYVPQIYKIAATMARTQEERDEFIQIAALAFINCLRTYQPEKGRYVTHATTWARSLINNFRLKPVAGQIYTPDSVRSKLSIFRKVVKKLRKQELPITTERIAKEGGLTLKAVELLIVLEGAYFPSVNAPVKNTSDEGMTLGDMMVCEEPDPEEVYTKSNLLDVQTNLLTEALGTLSARDEFVLRARHGLALDKRHTLKEISDRLDVSRERVRQIEVEAFYKLQKWMRSKYKN